MHVLIGLCHFGCFHAIQRANERVRRFGVSHGSSGQKPLLTPERRTLTAVIDLAKQSSSGTWRTLGTAGVAILCAMTSPLTADVIPQMGGGQVGMQSAPMKHIDITFDGAAVQAHVDTSVPTPLLRPLSPPDVFDATAPWSVLQDKDYNFQYGWNAGGFITLPAGASVWVESLHTSAGLEVYSRPPATPAWSPILGTNGSNLRWKWSGAMTHNAYAVLDPLLSEYSADYRVYLGDATGMPLDGYESASVTLFFQAIPIESTLAGDFDRDGELTVIDVDQLGLAIATASSEPQFDVSADGVLDAHDLTYWVKELQRTWIGDANLDGQFNSSDLVATFQAGNYELDIEVGWAEGDWNADRRFGSSDLVAAFQDGGYEQGLAATGVAVPEPSTQLLTAIGVLLLALIRKF